MANAALVTGGTAGIGFASARVLAESGRTVYVTGRTQDRLDAAVGESEGLVGIRADMADLDDIRAVGERLENDGAKLDVLVVNAGVAQATTFGSASAAHYDGMFDLNVRGMFFTVQSLLPYLADGASVILIGSICAIKGMPDLSVYNATKAAVRSFARSWANDLRARRTRVNTLSPGPVLTSLVHQLQAESGGTVEAFESWAAESSPSGRIGQPEDIASVVRFLAGADAAHVNGVELFVDGGMSQI